MNRLLPFARVLDQKGNVPRPPLFRMFIEKRASKVGFVLESCEWNAKTLKLQNRCLIRNGQTSDVRRSDGLTSDGLTSDGRQRLNFALY